MAIKKKYAGRNDKATQQKINEETMALYQKEGFNPASGCLPMLIQLPVLIILYQLVINPLTYICMLPKESINSGAIDKKEEVLAGETAPDVVYVLDQLGVENAKSITQIDMINYIRANGSENLAEFADVPQFQEKIKSKDDLPNFIIFGGKFDLSKRPAVSEINLLLIIPVMTFFVSLLSMKITKKFTYQPETAANMGASGAIMNMTMPLLSVFVTFQVSAAIGIYWIFKNVLGSAKQIALSRFMPMPKFTEEDYRAAEKEAGAAPKQKKTEKKRSLHRIDDEEDTGSGNDNGGSDKNEKNSKGNADDNCGKIGGGEANARIAPAPLKQEKPQDKNNKK